MPRKKQKGGPPPRAHRPSGPGKAGTAPSSQAKKKGPKQDPAAGGAIKEGNQKRQSLQANQRPIVPFLRGDRILLVGEGEYSFLILVALIELFRPLLCVQFVLQMIT